MSLAAHDHAAPTLPRGYDHLAANALERNLFFERAMLQPALAHLADTDVTLCAALDPESAIVQAALPVRRAAGRYGPLPTPVPLTAWHHPYCLVGTPLVATEDAHGALDALLAKASRIDQGAKVLLLPMLREGGPFWDLLVTVTRQTDRPMQVLARTQRAGLHMADPRAQRLFKKKTRQSLGASAKKLAQRGTVEHHVVTSPSAMPDALSAFFNLEAAGWKGKRGTALATIGHDGFAGEVMMNLAQTGRARADLTLLDERPVAATLSICSGSQEAPVWMPWKTSYSEAHAACAPGSINLGELSEDLHDQATQNGTALQLDSLAGPESVIANRLWPHQQSFADVLIDLTPGGSTAFTAILLAERTRRRTIAAAKTARDAIRAARKGAAGR